MDEDGCKHDMPHRRGIIASILASGNDPVSDETANSGGGWDFAGCPLRIGNNRITDVLASRLRSVVTDLPAMRRPKST